MKAILILVFGIMGTVATGWISGSEPLSPEQILLLMEASRSRYQNLEATILEQTFQPMPNSPAPVLQGSTRFTIRMTPERRYLDMDMQTHADQRINKVERYVLTPNKAKRYRLNRNDNVASGLVAQSSSMQGIHAHSVYDAIWGIQNIPWSMIHEQIHTASITADQGLHVLEIRFDDSGQSPRLRIWIDPEKGYIPVLNAMISPDKSISSQIDCRDWKMVDNLWIPMSYTYSAPTFGFRQEFEVQSVLLNRPIADNQMDFDFPEGTTVDDRLRGVKYQVPKANSPRANSEVEAISPLAAPIDDYDLARVATKSDEMIAYQINVPQSPTQIKLSPAYVWVLPGKNQYTLELAPDSKTRPTLSDKSISDSPLVLQSMDDQLAASGKLVVTLERPDGHKAFADAVLTLDFAGTKVPIHFVAAPLP